MKSLARQILEKSLDSQERIHSFEQSLKELFRNFHISHTKHHNNTNISIGNDKGKTLLSFSIHDLDGILTIEDVEFASGSGTQGSNAIVLAKIQKILNLWSKDHNDGIDGRKSY